ncbi:unnamed protein product [Acanthoscelides obtectus]|uniref:Protein-tyrosine-phosphatase n=1 Tax=Acanthoscelides obtectus TaxID=200917 RepID=A0A9P0P773_ACAOB|nr:unnamed protein product [Acanthoscelides obtectus]CAK1630671.1 Dual specificity protein phosphatase 14 [Acanthoscelides obtectus]
MKETVASSEINMKEYLDSPESTEDSSPIDDLGQTSGSDRLVIVKSANVQDVLIDTIQMEIQLRPDSPRPIIPTNVSEITKQLILTSASSVNADTLATLGISCVISCAPELPDSPLTDQLIYHKVDVTDSGCSRILPHFDVAADLINNQVAAMGGRTLVFCVAGVSRSASICIAYLMKHFKLSLLEAYNLVKSSRPRIRPNCGFFKQLIEYEKSLFGCNTVHMVFNDVVRMEIPDVYESDYKVVTYRRKRVVGNKG